MQSNTQTPDLSLEGKYQLALAALKEARENCDSPHACSTLIDSALKELGEEE